MFKSFAHTCEVSSSNNFDVKIAVYVGLKVADGSEM